MIKYLNSKNEKFKSQDEKAQQIRTIQVESQSQICST